ncbi:MAG: sigma-E processing peptidase SpoIIGA [Candidatus Coproplasma sp.]
MQIYIEFALIENFCMDFALLTCAKVAVKNPASYLRIAFASAIGATFAVCFPLFNLSDVLTVVVKVFSGLAIAAVAGRFQSFKGYIKFALAFILATFLSGGALIAVFTLTGISYTDGGGYILSSVPVGIPFFAVICLAIAIKKISAKRVNTKVIEVRCKIYSGGKYVATNAFYDSGNKVYLNGVPVCVAPRHIAVQLVDITLIKTFAPIHTVAGEGKLPVFYADKMEIDDGKKIKAINNVLIGVSPKHISKFVLHPDLSEVD